VALDYIFQTYDSGVLEEEDVNGWRPIHEAARSGALDALIFLVEHAKVHVNARTSFGRGGTPLYYAIKTNGEDHPAVRYLKEIGAVYQEEL